MKKPSFINSDEQWTYKLRVPVEIQALEIEERSKTFLKANVHSGRGMIEIRLFKKQIRILVVGLCFSDKNGDNHYCRCDGGKRNLVFNRFSILIDPAGI